ncbi:MAG: hypothetical protein IPM14_02135 [bacterium]|nr:hypothetical protein [bacterium]
MKSIFISLFLTMILGLGKSNAWVYPEHRDIMLLAISKLSADHTSTLDGLWATSQNRI